MVSRVEAARHGRLRVLVRGQPNRGAAATRRSVVGAVQACTAVAGHRRANAAVSKLNLVAGARGLRRRLAVEMMEWRRHRSERCCAVCPFLVCGAGRRGGALRTALVSPVCDVFFINARRSIVKRTAGKKMKAGKQRCCCGEHGLRSPNCSHKALGCNSNWTKERRKGRMRHIAQFTARAVASVHKALREGKNSHE